MNITMLTYGTRGDVQPFVALGLGLKKAGHKVRLAAPETFKNFVEGFGLEFFPLPGVPAELSRRLVDEARMNPVRTIRAISDFAMPIAVSVMRAAREACKDADAVIHTFLLALAIGVGWFATSFQATVKQSQQDQAQYSVGADVRLTEHNTALKVDRVQPTSNYLAQPEVEAASNAVRLNNINFSLSGATLNNGSAYVSVRPLGAVDSATCGGYSLQWGGVP